MPLDALFMFASVLHISLFIKLEVWAGCVVDGKSLLKGLLKTHAIQLQ